MKKLLLAAIAPVLFLLDRVLKLWAYNDLRLLPGGMLEVIPGVFRLRFAENDGAAFSMLAGNRWLLIGLTGLIMLVILLYVMRSKSATSGMRAALLVVLAGGLGNLYDRIARGLVPDYAELLFVRFAVFNLADVFVCGGAALFAVLLILQERRGVARA